jgi:protein TonB
MATVRAKSHVLGASGRMLVVAAIHVCAGVLIAQGLEIKSSLEGQRAIEVTSIPERSPDDPLQPLPEAQMTDIPVILVPPIVDAFESDEPVEESTALTATNDTSIGTDTRVDSGTALPEAKIVGVRTDTRHPLSQPPYPPIAIRLSEEGTGVVAVWVLPDGRVGDVRMERSTGSPRLDSAALAEARRWRMLPATRDGAPFAQWHSVRVVFRLDNR